MIGYLQSIQKVLAIAAGFATLPLFLSLADLQPPWPPAIGYVSAALVMLASVFVWEWVRAARRAVRRGWMIAALVLTLGGLGTYFTLYSLFVDDVPGTAGRVIRGYACTADAALLYGPACPDLPRDALQAAQWEAPLLWTRRSLTIVRLGLTASWLAFTAGLIAAVGAAVAGRKIGGGPVDAADVAAVRTGKKRR